MKDKIIYSLFVLVLTILTFILTTTYLLTTSKERGYTEVKKKYYDIILNNVSIDYDTQMTVKLDNKENNISVKIPDLNEFKKTNSFSIDVTNIGNIDAIVTEYYIGNIKSNINTTNCNIELSLLEDTIIKGGETKKLNIKITYNGKDEISNPYYFFDIKYRFNEVNL